MLDDVDVVDRFSQHLGVRHPVLLGARGLGFAQDFEIAHRHAFLKALAEDFAFALHRGFHPQREGVGARDADAVQTAGDLIAAGLFALPARVQHGHDEGEGADALFRVDAGGDAAPVVLHAHGAVFVNLDLDEVAVPGQRLVHGVVQHFAEHLVQTALAVVAHVHAGAQAHGLQTLQDLDVGFGVSLVDPAELSFTDFLRGDLFGGQFFGIHVVGHHCNQARPGRPSLVISPWNLPENGPARPGGPGGVGRVG